VKARDGIPALLPALPGGRLSGAACVLLLPTVAFPLLWRQLGMLLPLATNFLVSTTKTFCPQCHWLPSFLPLRILSGLVTEPVAAGGGAGGAALDGDGVAGGRGGARLGLRPPVVLLRHRERLRLRGRDRHGRLRP